MKKIVFIIMALVATIELNAQQMKVITVVESIVPLGLGRSRIIENQDEVDYTDFTTDRADGKKSSQGDVQRKDLKVENLSETKLLNFYSGVGINFQNIASNDAVITSKINKMLQDGWSLAFVTSGVESVAGKSDKHGIFITRLFFSKE